MQLRPLIRALVLPFLLMGEIQADQQAPSASEAAASAIHHAVEAYAVAGFQAPPTNAWPGLFGKFTGPNVGLDGIIDAAFELQMDYEHRGFTNISISVAADRIQNGVVALHVFRAPSRDILVSGKPATRAGAGRRTDAESQTARLTTPKPPPPPQPHFPVKAYQVEGNTLLPESVIESLLAKYTGTNVALSNVVQAASDLQQDYRRRGFATVRVSIPEQSATNHIVRFQVFEGRLAEVLVANNRYFSSNNVMRALPSLRTNAMLNSILFQAELDRANANQDRQVYAVLSPGPEENTTTLTLETKDRFPLHGKLDLNNQSSPGTPDLRVNGSAVYNNLWQLDHSMGFQYGFSPESMKSDDAWNFYDRPQVANYGGFYRLPLGAPSAIADTVANQPGRFGYDEATRQFRLPAASGRTELNLYASRSTIDTGILNLFSGNLYTTNGNSLDRTDLQQDLTINKVVGGRLSVPLHSTQTFQSGISGGLDYKAYEITSKKTNVFILSGTQVDYGNDPSHPQTNITRQVDPSPVPTTMRSLEYLPVAIRYDASLRDRWGMTAFGVGLGVNPWHSGSGRDLQNLTFSTLSSGNWVILSPSITRDIMWRTNWLLTLRADGQWSSEPLISNEQYGLGGLGTVRGYHEGAVFGDSGWHVTAEQKTPYHVLGSVYRNHPLSLRGAVFMDYGEAYLLDPRGRSDRTPLWGVGFGGVANIGANWETRLLFSWPLLDTILLESGQPRFDFAISAQF